MQTSSSTFLSGDYSWSKLSPTNIPPKHWESCSTPQIQTSSTGMELYKNKKGCCCTVCKIPTKYNDSSGICVCSQERLSYIGKLSKRERRYQAEAEKGQGPSPFSFLPLYLFQTSLGWILASTVLLWKGSSPLGSGGMKSDGNLLIFSKVIVTAQFTLGREGSDGDSSNVTLLESVGYKTALSYSFWG